MINRTMMTKPYDARLARINFRQTLLKSGVLLNGLLNQGNFNGYLVKSGQAKLSRFHSNICLKLKKWVLRQN